MNKTLKSVRILWWVQSMAEEENTWSHTKPWLFPVPRGLPQPLCVASDDFHSLLPDGRNWGRKPPFQAASFQPARAFSPQHNSLNQNACCMFDPWFALPSCSAKLQRAAGEPCTTACNPLGLDGAVLDGDMKKLRLETLWEWGAAWWERRNTTWVLGIQLHAVQEGRLGESGSFYVPCPCLQWFQGIFTPFRASVVQSEGKWTQVCLVLGVGLIAELDLILHLSLSVGSLSFFQFKLSLLLVGWCVI